MFKKSCAVILAMFIACSFWVAYSKPLFLDYSDEFETYSNLKSAGEIERQNKNSFTYVFIRYGEGITLDKQSVKKLKLNKDKIFLEFNAKEVKTSASAVGTSFYGYSKNIKYCEIVDGKKINLHVFVSKDGSLSVGSPIIYGSFWF